MTSDSSSWWERVAHTTVGDALRRCLGTALNWRQKLIDELVEVQLPKPCECLVETVIEKTRLWRSEKCDLVLELCAHFHDGIEAGITPEELVGSFGAPKQVARLIRRAKKRNRPWLWQAAHQFRQVVGIGILFYLVLVVMALFRHPAPSVDYITRLNSSANAAAQADQAWPLYRPIFLDYAERELDVRMVEARPGEAGWEEAHALIQENVPMCQARRKMGAEMTA